MNRALNLALGRPTALWLRAWWLGLIYSAIGVVLTYPAVIHPATWVLGRGVDALQFVWGIWHWEKILVHGGNPFFTADLYYPMTISLLMHTWAPVKTLLMAPLAWLGNETLAYNLGFWLTFGLKGSGMYLLIKTYDADDYAAFLGGLVFAFAPYYMAHGHGHFHTISNEAMPWLLYLWRMAGQRISGPRLLAMAAWSLYLFFCDYQGFIFFGMLMLGYWAYLGWNQRPALKSEVQRMLPLLLLVGGLLAVFVLSMAGQLRQYNMRSLHSGVWGGAEYFCLDILSLFLPSELHPLWGRAVAHFNDTWRLTGSTALGGNISERTVTLGYGVLLVILAGARWWWREKSLRAWAMAGLGFWLFTFGPVIRLGGFALNQITRFNFYQFDGFEVFLPSPYILIHYLPVLNGLREPARFIIITLLALTVIFAVSYHRLQFAWQLRPTGKKLLFGATLTVILFEFWTAPYPVLKLAAENPAYAVIRQDLRLDRAVLDMPVSPWVKMARPMYFQTIHGHPIIGGNTSRESGQQLAYKEKYAVLGQLMRGEENFSARDLQPALRELSIGYLVCREEKVSGRLARLQAELPGLEPLTAWNPQQPVQVWKYQPEK